MNMKNNIKTYKLVIASLLLSSFSGYAQVRDSLNIDKVELGFGVKQEMSKSTASVATISGDELRQSSAINLKDALYGRLLGLTALKNGGFEGDRDFGAFFNIRGLQTTSETGVLILVDGFERPIDRLSLEEVESVTVYKDAAAVALYGYKGLNGVISVITKRGSDEKRKVNVNYLHKFTFLPSTPKMADAYTYANALNEARRNDGMSDAYNSFELDAFKNNKYPFVYPNVNWKDEALNNMGSEDQLNLSLEGSANKIKHYILFNYTGNRGLLKGTDKNDGYSTQLISSKANIRMNVDYQMTSTTLIKVNVLGTFVETNRPSSIDAGGVFENIYYLPSAAFPVQTEGGLWGGSTTYGTKNLVASIQATGHAKTHARSLFTDLTLKQDLGFITKGLSLSLRAGYDNYSEILEDRTRGFSYGNTRYVFDESGNVVDEITYQAGDMTNNLNFSSKLNYHWRRANYVATLDYDRKFGDHQVNASAIFNGEVGVYPDRYNETHRSNFMLSAHYDYQSKYVADIVMGMTGSNRAYPEKWDFSPTVSLGWVASNEDFLKDNDVIQLLKLRASAGILHTDYVPLNGLTFEDYSGGAGDYYFGDGYSQTWGFYLKYSPTASFRHERAIMTNIGLDLQTLKKLNFTADFYYNRRDNILQSGDGINSAVFGLPAAYYNKGIVDSKGVELGLDYTGNVGHLNYHIGGMFTYGTSKIIDIVETPQAFKNLSKIGSKPGAVYGLEVIGIYQNQEQIAEHPQEFGAVQVGDLMYKDQNGDEIIDENDKVELNYTNGVPEINYALNIGFEYKGFGVNATFQGAGNFYRPLDKVGVFKPMTNNANVSEYYLANCWRPDQDNSHARFPRLSASGSVNNNQTSDLWYADGSFFKLRNCEIYYNFSQKLLNKTFIKGLKVFAKGENLFSLDKFPAGVDSEVYWSNAYPTLSSVSAGLSVNF